MTSATGRESSWNAPPLLPLVLWGTPPGLELILRQEGLPIVVRSAEADTPIVEGRFVVVDPRVVRRSLIDRVVTQHHQVIRIDDLASGSGTRIWRDLIDTRSAPMAWIAAGRPLVERVQRGGRTARSREILGRLRTILARAGGLWVRFAAFPAPYRSAFNLRVDLDEPVPADYFRFARAREPIADCTTHFVSTQAYGASRRVMDDLRNHDTQSHGHHHHIYRDLESNAVNLRRADACLRNLGFDPSGFASPHGRWNVGLDRVVSDLGYSYASEFQLGYDELPFRPWLGDCFSDILQVPVHPVCEGLFLDAGLTMGGIIALHYAETVRSKLANHEAAFVYGHPERRLGRYPEVIRAIAREVEQAPLAWRVTLTEFARWWRERECFSGTLRELGSGRYQWVADTKSSARTAAIEIVRGRHHAHLRLDGSRLEFRLDALAYEATREASSVAAPLPHRVGRGFRSIVREMLDWETVTPVEELSSRTFAGRLKRELRRRRDRVA
ncbi:MAG: hypothetical protein SFX72_07520 [Isosphaeraceae bacterium]|nr:hypothetical protein [Isosphaeraceae bacterium]